MKCKCGHALDKHLSQKVWDDAQGAYVYQPGPCGNEHCGCGCFEEQWGLLDEPPPLAEHG